MCEKRELYAVVLLLVLPLSQPLAPPWVPAIGLGFISALSPPLSTLRASGFPILLVSSLHSPPCFLHPIGARGDHRPRAKWP
jgi:hypothetical protein